jgi:hypothetical protein
VPLISPKVPQGLDWGFAQFSVLKGGQLKNDGTFVKSTPKKFIFVLTIRHRVPNKLNPIPYRLAIAATLGEIQTATFVRTGQVHTETFICGSDNLNHACENPSIAENRQ